MKRSLYPLWFMMCLGLMIGCVEPYEVNIPDSDRILVVDGLVTDQAEACQVKLSWSSPLSADSYDKVSNANVRIGMRDGTTVSLQQTEPGIYETDSSSFRGIIGEEYQLLIGLNTDSYASDWMRLNASPPIDSLYAAYDERVTTAGQLQGMQIFIDTEDPAGESRYYRWEWIETWKYAAAFPANLQYIGNNETELIPYYPICFHTATSRSINIATTAQNVADRLLAYPLLFVDTRSSRLDKRYSLLVRQYVMSEQEYLFRKAIKESTENVGSLFDRQPQSRTGNVHNLSDETEPVLGFFSASAVTQKRLYIARKEVPLGVVVYNGYRDCFLGLDTLARGPQAETDITIFNKINSGQVFYSFVDWPAITAYVFTSRRCSDCRVEGGSEIIPDFWTE